MVRYQQRDQRPRRIAARRHRRDGGIAAAVGAAVGCLARIELGVDPEAMLEIVDAERDGFGIAHRAEMSGDFEAVAVRFLDRGAKFGAGDVHVGLERGRTLRRPEADGGARVRRIGELVHLDEGAARAFEIGRRHIHVRAGNMTRIDLLLEIEVGIGLDAAGGAKRGDAGGEIEPGRGKRHLRHDQRFVAMAGGIQIGPGDVIDMVVHAHQARHHAFSRRVDGPVSVRNGVGAWPYRGDAATLDQQCPVGLGGAPVPSMIRTCVSAILPAATLTNGLTASPGAAACGRMRAVISTSAGMSTRAGAAAPRRSIAASGVSLRSMASRPLERFQEKCAAVFRPEPRQIQAHLGLYHPEPPGQAAVTGIRRRR